MLVVEGADEYPVHSNIFSFFPFPFSAITIHPTPPLHLIPHPLPPIPKLLPNPGLKLSTPYKPPPKLPSLERVRLRNGVDAACCRGRDGLRVGGSAGAAAEDDEAGWFVGF